MIDNLGNVGKAKGKDGEGMKVCHQAHVLLEPALHGVYAACKVLKYPFLSTLIETSSSVMLTKSSKQIPLLPVMSEPLAHHSPSPS